MAEKEKAPVQHEHHESHEDKHNRAKEHEKLQETIEAGKKAKHEAKDRLEDIRSSIDQEATKTAAVKNEQEADADNDQGPAIIDRKVKATAFKKELHRIQSHLPKSQRSMSKFIHSRPVEVVSEVGGKTVARPSGLLGGGIVAFVGTLALVIISRHYGFSYNFFVFLALLVGGFFLGLILEMIIRAFTKARS